MPGPNTNATADAAEREDVTSLLMAWSEGDEQALDKLMPIVYRELHQLAHRFISRERSGHGLQTTALVNEAYLRLLDCSRIRWQDRAHFFAVSAKLMRRILVDEARRQNLKRGRGVEHVPIENAAEIGGTRPIDLVALDDAMNALGQMDPRKMHVVEMRYFGGLSVEETAHVLKISTVTVVRDWNSAKAWLYRQMRANTADAP